MLELFEIRNFPRRCHASEVSYLTSSLLTHIFVRTQLCTVLVGRGPTICTQVIHPVTSGWQGRSHALNVRIVPLVVRSSTHISRCLSSKNGPDVPIKCNFLCNYCALTKAMLLLRLLQTSCYRSSPSCLRCAAFAMTVHLLSRAI